MACHVHTINKGTSLITLLQLIAMIVQNHTLRIPNVWVMTGLYTLSGLPGRDGRDRID